MILIPFAFNFIDICLGKFKPFLVKGFISTKLVNGNLESYRH